jgi:hypothetical protein
LVGKKKIRSGSKPPQLLDLVRTENMTDEIPLQTTPSKVSSKVKKTFKTVEEIQMKDVCYGDLTGSHEESSSFSEKSSEGRSSSNSTDDDDQNECTPEAFHILGKKVAKGTEWNYDLSRTLSSFSDSNTDQTLARVLSQSLLFLEKDRTILHWLEGFVSFFELHFAKMSKRPDLTGENPEEDWISKKSVPTLIICQPQYCYSDKDAELALEEEYPELVLQLQKYADLINPRNLIVVMVTYGAVVPWDRTLPSCWKRLLKQNFSIKEKSTGNKCKQCWVQIMLVNSEEVDDRDNSLGLIIFF